MNRPTLGERAALIRRLAEAMLGLGGVRVVWVFGSFARGELFRDIDIAVLLEDPGQWRTLAKVEARAERALEGRPHTLDVVPINDATPSFQRQVCTEGVVLFESVAGEALDATVSAISRDIDYREWLRVHDQRSA